MANTTITWLGHASFLFVTPEGKRIVLDPWYEGNPSFPESAKAELENIDAILLTHGHMDHTGNAITLAQQTKAPVAGIVELIGWVQGQGVDATQCIGFNKGGCIEIAGIKATLTTAHHSSSISNGSISLYLGDPCGFILEFSDGCVVYHTGDTCVHSDMALMGEIYQPNVTILPIGDFYTMGPRQAAHSLKLIGSKFAIPEHYGTFPALHGNPAALQSELNKLQLNTEIIALQPGEAWTYSA